MWNEALEARGDHQLLQVEPHDDGVIGKNARDRSRLEGVRVAAEEVRHRGAEHVDQRERQDRDVHIEPRERPEQAEQRLGRGRELRGEVRDEDDLVLPRASLVISAGVSACSSADMRSSRIGSSDAGACRANRTSSRPGDETDTVGRGSGLSHRRDATRRSSGTSVLLSERR